MLGSKLIILILAGAAFLFVYARAVERSTLFVPEKGITQTPESIGLAFEDVYFKAHDGTKLNGWLVKSPGAKRTLLFFHGNAGNNSGRIDKLELFYVLGVNTFILDYRGYGNSGGTPSEKSMYADALSAYDYLTSRDDIDPDGIITYGASLGGAPAVDLASKRKVAALIVDSSFSNATDMAKRILPFVPSFFVGAKLDSLNKIKCVFVPKLFIHSSEDETVPFELGQKLFNAAPEPKTFLEVAGGHMDSHIYDQKRFASGLSQFLQELDHARK